MWLRLQILLKGVAFAGGRRRTNLLLRPYDLVLNSCPSLRCEIRLIFVFLWYKVSGWDCGQAVVPCGCTASRCTKHFSWKVEERDHTASIPLLVPSRCCANTNHWIFTQFLCLLRAPAVYSFAPVLCFWQHPAVVVLRLWLGVSRPCALSFGVLWLPVAQRGGELAPRWAGWAVACCWDQPWHGLQGTGRWDALSGFVFAAPRISS